MKNDPFLKLLAVAIFASVVLAFANSAHAARHLNDLVEQGNAASAVPAAADAAGSAVAEAR